MDLGHSWYSSLFSKIGVEKLPWWMVMMIMIYLFMSYVYYISWRGYQHREGQSSTRLPCLVPEDLDHPATSLMCLSLWSGLVFRGSHGQPCFYMSLFQGWWTCQEVIPICDGISHWFCQSVTASSNKLPYGGILTFTFCHNFGVPGCLPSLRLHPPPTYPAPPTHPSSLLAGVPGHCGRLTVYVRSTTWHPKVTLLLLLMESQNTLRGYPKISH